MVRQAAFALERGQEGMVRGCPLCGGHVTDSACTGCFAPIEVVQSIASRADKARFVGVLGPSGVGKTVYLGVMLDLLSRGCHNLSGLARGPFSVSLHRNVMLSLQSQRFPEKTPREADHWQWVHCEVETGPKGPRFDLVTPDVAGEAVMSELERTGSNPTIRALLVRSTGLVVLLDILEIIAGGQGQELFAMQLVSYLDSIRPSRRGLLDTPVAFVLTKADLCDDVIDDPTTFVRSHAPALAKLCSARLRHAQYFRSGIAGSCGILCDKFGRESLIPLRFEPRGVVEPLKWMAPLIR